jgi:hypothetical protein
MKLTDDKKMAHNNAWQSHRKVTAGLKKSRGKIYSLSATRTMHSGAKRQNETRCGLGDDQ